MPARFRFGRRTGAGVRPRGVRVPRTTGGSDAPDPPKNRNPRACPQRRYDRDSCPTEPTENSVGRGLAFPPARGHRPPSAGVPAGRGPLTGTEPQRSMPAEERRRPAVEPSRAGRIPGSPPGSGSAPRPPRRRTPAPGGPPGSRAVLCAGSPLGPVVSGSPARALPPAVSAPRRPRGPAGRATRARPAADPPGGSPPVAAARATRWPPSGRPAATGPVRPVPPRCRPARHRDAPGYRSGGGMRRRPGGGLSSGRPGRAGCASRSRSPRRGRW